MPWSRIREFGKYVFFAIRENKIIAKSSDFTVSDGTRGLDWVFHVLCMLAAMGLTRLYECKSRVILCL